MSAIYYDLTELYLGSRGKIKFYGIGRVVAEIAYDISILNPDVRFVVFDETRRGLFEVKPHLGKSSSNGLVDIGIPLRGMPLRLRTTHENASPLKVGFSVATRFLVEKINRLRFPDFKHFFTRIEPTNGVLISAGRPKFLADLCDFLAQSKSGVEVHAILHDMIPLHDYHPSPVRFQRNFRFDNERIIRHAAKVISVSNYTKLEIARGVKDGFIPAPKCEAVIQLCLESRSDGETANIVLPVRDYILAVGITLGRKNLDVILDAMAHMIEKGKTPPLLVIAGTPRTRNRESIERGRFSTLLPHVRFENSPSQANLIVLYQHALATVMASKLEGWGLPLGESLWNGTPVISSPNSSLPEVGGDLAVYFDPDNAEELASIIDRFQTDKDYYLALKRRIALAKPSMRTWRDVAKDHLMVAGFTQVANA